MDVLIETAEGKSIELEIWYFDTVLEIKRKIHKYYNFPVGRQTLFFDGVVLSDDKNIEHYNILNCSRIRLVVQPDHKSTADNTIIDEHCSEEKKTMKVMVEPVNSTKKLAVEINPLDNVSELRKDIQRLKVERLLHIPEPDYFFICKQKVMDENMSFRWHDVRHGDTIELFNGRITRA